MKHKKIVGLDLGDKFSYACMLDADTGEVIKEKRIATRASCLETFFAGQPAILIAIETRTHSPLFIQCTEAKAAFYLSTDTSLDRFYPYPVGVSVSCL